MFEPALSLNGKASRFSGRRQSGKIIKLLIVDDSALMRKLLLEVFQTDGGFELRAAKNGVEALKELRAFNPDVITLDINMPEMDGLTALSMLMAERPVPVVMVSSLTEKGAMATFEALALGAVDFIPKPGGTISLSIEAISQMLVEKVKSAAKCRMTSKKALGTRTSAPSHQVDTTAKARLTTDQRGPSHSLVVSAEHSTVVRGMPQSPCSSLASIPTSQAKFRAHGVVVIGVSTGGPKALEEILPKLPRNFQWPVVVAQHMPSTFTEAFARRLDGLCELSVVEVNRPMRLEPGFVYIGKGGTDMQVTERLGVLTVLPKPENPEFLWHPSVEALVQSVHKVMQPSQCLGVMLTGMGYDGAQAMSELKHAGAYAIAESEESATVFGMPGELIKRQGANVVLPCSRIAEQIISWVDRRR